MRNDVVARFTFLVLSVLLLISLFGRCAHAQAASEKGYRISAISSGSGESPITSGIFATMQLKNSGCGFIEVTAQETQAWLMHGCDKDFGPVRTNLYWSVGHQGGAPWVGPYLAATIPFAKVGGHEISLTGLAWPGFFLGREPSSRRTENDGVQNHEALLAGWFELLSLNVGRVSFTASHLNYLDTPNEYLYGVEYTKKLVENVDAKGSVNWYQAKKPEDRRFMYFIGATWRPKK
ncbi:MAG: hypothetical protein A3D49_02995 [Candidatus Zambryskibacteria bacterium RIFCSPHIGHO2_02_FULL_43_37]|uniref:Uncharacterized protein n=1 Tax=Candidatus Zambryskibacteria bacterium RIFCSPHIGHO2_02_FULL_43_37 TaxID=1802749 RepID=A0A1G2THK0_9BACT|nr:MAG: hypothetical protein A2723_01035 [Candidatus Zambryskibacteria bacterium RIFCSPHIGHO2_01_FULL_52_18]OHA96780.1 MAG: hypothetical protein A3D49_02995 [Candidatus Zambryskibacteria bacterium RIFCSPHIGHO2_02_FULL_43_37]OHB07473.1 MAG: hypothetical protein A2944_02065 [Candidatus Zambryskibacteria bacterium RIFCSPLOWO2_01_FULL_52_12]